MGICYRFLRTVLCSDDQLTWPLFYFFEKNAHPHLISPMYLYKYICGYLFTLFHVDIFSCFSAKSWSFSTDYFLL